MVNPKPDDPVSEKHGGDEIYLVKERGAENVSRP
jgi:hypothetical protein